MSTKYKGLTSREVIGVLKEGSQVYGETSVKSKLVLEYIERLHGALDHADGSDFFGTEGWRKSLLGEDS